VCCWGVLFIGGRLFDVVCCLASFPLFTGVVIRARMHGCRALSHCIPFNPLLMAVLCTAAYCCLVQV
jgi:hypothetical protein